MSSYPAVSPEDISTFWLHGVPRNWALKPLWAVASCNDETLPEDTSIDRTLTYVEISDVSAGRGITGSTKVLFAQAPSRARRVVRQGDVIVSTVRTYLKAIAHISDQYAGVVVSTGFAVLRPFGLYDRFLAYVLTCESMIAEVIARSVGVSYPAINSSDLLRIKVPVPPHGEQQAIAAFLDRETAKIDALVSEQERLLVLLEEKRQAVIANAVSKGLDPNAPMKGSGVEWLGQVPAHWRVVRLAYYASIENGSTPNRNDLRYWDEGDIPWVGSGEVNQYIVNEPSEYVTALALDECSLRVVPKGAVLVGLVGQGRTRAMSALLGINAAINQNVAAVIAGERLMPAFLHYSLQAAYEHLRECARGGNQAALNCEIISAFRIAIPPIQEQELIAAHLDAARDAVECLATESRRSISLLNERRAALVSAAVTGKLDVLALIPATEPALAAE